MRRPLTRLVPALAVLGFAILAAHPADAASVAAIRGESRPAVPAGFVQLVDDTGTLAVVVPTTWTDVDTAPDVNDDGTPRPYIAASTNIQTFIQTFDAPGVAYWAEPFTTDPQTVIDGSGLTSGCVSTVVEPYQSPLFTGLVQVGTQCGSGSATWNMVVASPASGELTVVLQVQTASAADQAAFDMVLNTFDVFASGTLAPGTVPTVPGAPTVPTVPGAPTITTLPTVPTAPTLPAAPTVAGVPTVPTVQGVPSPLADAAAAGYRAFVGGLGSVPYVDEDSLKVGDCPVIDVTVFNQLTSASGLTGPFDAESGGEMETFDDPVVGQPLVPVGLFCDFDVSDDLVVQVSSAEVGVLDIGANPAVLEAVQPILGSDVTPGPAGIGGEVVTTCGPPILDDTECGGFWVGDQLLVYVSISFETVADPDAADLVFQSVLPAVLQKLGSFAS